MVAVNILLPQHLNEEVCMYVRRGVSAGVCGVYACACVCVCVCVCVRVCVCVCLCVTTFVWCNWCKTPFEV